MSYSDLYDDLYSAYDPIYASPWSGNLLPLADADFESGSPTWASVSNASAIADTSSQAFSGTSSLTFTATASADCQIAAGQVSGIIPAKSYVVSGYIRTPASKTVKIGVRWYQADGTTLISTTFGPNITSTAGGWTPIYGKLTSPALAAKASVTVVVVAANAGAVENLDGVFLARSDVCVLIDWTNPSFSGVGGNAFADMTGFARMDVGLQLQRGRQDDINDVQAGTCSFTLQNDSGWFTAQCSQSPWAITLGRRAQISVSDELGVWHVRHDGAVSQIDYEVDILGATNMANVTTSDVFAFMSRQKSLSCWTKETVLADGPLYHWSLNDTQNFYLETTGNGGPALQARSYTSSGTTAGQLNAASGNGGVEVEADTRQGTVGPYNSPIQSPAWVPNIVAQSQYGQFVGDNGYALIASLPTAVQPNVNTNNYTFECWFMMDPSIHASYKNAKVGPFTVMSLGESRTGYCWTAGVYPQSTGDVNFNLKAYNQPPSFIGTSFNGSPTVLANIAYTTFASDTQNQPHHLVVTIDGATGGGTVTMWVDGLNIGNYLLGRKRYFDTLVIGSAYGGFGSWNGAISLTSLYNYKMTSAQIQNHYNVGLSGHYLEFTDFIASKLVTIGGVPSFWNNVPAAGALGTGNACSQADYFDLSGSNALGALQTVEQIEDGLLYIDALGRINFHTRDWRMGYGGPNQTLPAKCFSPDLGYTLNDQFLITEETVGSTITVTGSTTINAAAAALYGDYPQGTPESPNAVALVSYATGYGQAGLQGQNFQLDPEIADFAAWQVNAIGTQYMRPGTLTMDILAPDSAQPAVSTLYGLEIDNMVALSGMPASMPDQSYSMEFFIEGVSETITESSRTLSFYTTPAAIQRAWKPGDATYGQLGLNTRIGRSDIAHNNQGVDARGKAGEGDPGPPFWPPVFGTNMNNHAATGHGFVGGADIRGIAGNLNMLLNPPICVVGAVNNAQTFSTGTTNRVAWDTTYVDTINGMGAIPNWPNWYCIMQTGWYDLDCTLIWSKGTQGNAHVHRAQIIVAYQAAAALLNNTGDPTTVNRVDLVGAELPFNSVSQNNTDTVSTRVYCGLGDMIAVNAFQDTGGNYNTGTDYSGSLLSIRWLGWGTTDDAFGLT